jgi:predicted outer membrane lipoprotein
MPHWLEISVPVILAAIFTALGALFLELRNHRDRLIRLEVKMEGILTAYWKDHNAARS